MRHECQAAHTASIYEEQTSTSNPARRHQGRIWKNNTEAGVRYNVTFTRLYKQGDQWASTESFGRDDLLLLAKPHWRRDCDHPL